MGGAAGSRVSKHGDKAKWGCEKRGSKEKGLERLQRGGVLRETRAVQQKATKVRERTLGVWSDEAKLGKKGREEGNIKKKDSKRALFSRQLKQQATISKTRQGVLKRPTRGTSSKVSKKIGRGEL